MRGIVLALAAMFGAACASAAQSPFPDESRTVFAAERARELVSQCSRVSPGPVEGVWTPDDEQLDDLEARLPALVESELRARWPGEAIRPLDYFRQYGGLVVGGRRVIYVNAFHRTLIEGEPPPQTRQTWRETAVKVCDGGPIVFGVEYDPRTRTFSNFAFNGAIG